MKSISLDKCNGIKTKKDVATFSSYYVKTYKASSRKCTHREKVYNKHISFQIYFQYDGSTKKYKSPTFSFNAVADHLAIVCSIIKKC